MSSERRIEQRVAHAIERDEQPTVDEWIAYLRTGNTVRIPLKTDIYDSPYYATYEDGEVAVYRPSTAPSYHAEDELYIRTLFGYYDPIPHTGEIPC